MADNRSPWARPDTPVEVPADPTAPSTLTTPPTAGSTTPFTASSTRTSSAGPATPHFGTPQAGNPQAGAPTGITSPRTPRGGAPLTAGAPHASYPQRSSNGPTSATGAISVTSTAVLGRQRSLGGAVTRATDAPPPDLLQFGPDDPDDPVKRNQLVMRWFGGAAALVVLVGVIVALVLVFSGSGGGLPKVFEDRAAAPPDTRPDLVKNCPVPSAYPEPLPPPPPPPGPRTVDEESGVSYAAYGAPWEEWPTVWTGGTLRVEYKVGQHFVTEAYSGGDYHASILSASIPATNNDALAVDLKCTGRQVAADVRNQYYPNPNRLEQLDERETRLGGRPAWVTKFRLHFNRAGLTAKSELVGLALIDVGRPEAAIVYISIPDTHRQFDPVVDEVLESVRPT